MKRLFIFCDGTGQDGLIVPSGPTEDTFSPQQAYAHGVTQVLTAMAEATEVHSLEGANGPKYVTNVLRLSRAVKPYSSDDPKIQQIVFYQSGIGSETDFKGEDSDFSEKTKKILARMYARTIASKIRDVYAFLAQNYEAGDEVFIFGFSRGAYTARKLAQLIDRIGLLTTENLGVFFNIWKDLYDKDKPFIPSDTRVNINIKCLGVWDTVEAIATADIDAFGLKDSVLPGSVKNAFHAVSLQENRKPFGPTLFTLAPNSNQVLKEIWFPGAHSDVGGSYERHELADISLFWMVGEIKALDLFEIDYNFINRSHQQNPDDWGTTQPRNMAASALWIAFAQDRMDGKYITDSQINHTSWEFAPVPAPPPFYYKRATMVSRERMEKKFGELKYATRNSYEEDCKKEWKSKLKGIPIVFDDITALFPPAVVKWAKSSSSMNSSYRVQGSLESGGKTLNVGRVKYKDGIHPGKVAEDNKVIYIGWDGKEVELKATDYFIEVLLQEGQHDMLAWYVVEGNLSQDALGGLILVESGKESDGTPLYVAKGYISTRGVASGKVRMGSTATIPLQGYERGVQRYAVLVFRSELYHFHHVAGQYMTGNNWAAIKEENTTRVRISITPKERTAPRVLMGLNYLDILKAPSSKSDVEFTVTSYADSITPSEFQIFVGAYHGTTLYNGGISWLKLSSGDPDIACGTLYCTQNYLKSIDFGWQFASPPILFAGLSRIHLPGLASKVGFVTSGVTTTGFNADTDVFGVMDISWVAVSRDKQGVLSGTFGDKGDTKAGYEGTIIFDPPFRYTPTVFTAFKNFSLNDGKNLRIRTSVTPSKDRMEWKIETWGDDSQLAYAEVAYLAIDSQF